MPNKLFAVIALTVVGLTVFGWSSISVTSLLTPAPATAQQFKPQDVWRQVYQMLPDLPLENQYISRETGKQATDNTLVSRLVRYHIYVKGRPPMYRLDWKLTMADYLGANDFMGEGAYPGNDSLRQNPIDNDRAVISRLSRAQRDALINAIVSIFNPNVAAESQRQPNPTPVQQPPAPNPNSRPPQPQPGDAQLLRQ
ncbi:hypothetical protein [Argonema antarcticum]|uniref:hypothetical protein n=1 Tax=Argonema antarcticum TaxID=2942763 RepID=UPI0020126A28|nr:hypothetical protein [Argonema antarcticum]MCL1473703.1 hypothetical protein [Argonema antarcticum A004/B2]